MPEISRFMDTITFVKPLINNKIEVRVDEAGGIVWNNGFDFCPVFLNK